MQHARPYRFTRRATILAAMLSLCTLLYPARGMAQGGERSILISSTIAGTVEHDPMAGGVAGETTEQITLPYYEQQCHEAAQWPAPSPWWVPIMHWKDRLVRHSHPNDPLRHMGLGGPLHGTSWRNRPLYAGWLIGTMYGDALTDTVDQSEDLFGGYRFGYDFDHYWGSELRLAWGNIDLRSDIPQQSSTAGHFYWDVNLLYYPWGDAHWRPFAGIGLGAARFRFDDAQGVHHEEYAVEVTLQIGVKYLLRKWLAVRFELTDNLAIGGDELNTMHNLSATAGVEWHFGGSRRSYFPWSPSTAMW